MTLRTSILIALHYFICCTRSLFLLLLCSLDCISVHFFSAFHFNINSIRTLLQEKSVCAQTQVSNQISIKFQSSLTSISHKANCLNKSHHITYMLRTSLIDSTPQSPQPHFAMFCLFFFFPTVTSI